MIGEEQIEKLVEILLERVNKSNEYFLKRIGNAIREIRQLTPSQAQKLVQILKYGGNYEDIIKEISNYTNMNIKEIDTIFNSYAKKDQQFYEKFYKYRDIPFVEYGNNMALKRQTQALSNIAMNEMYNFTRLNVLGYTIRDVDGKVKFIGLRETYNRLLDDALLNVGQGKETFDSAMSRIINDIGSSGIKTINYESGRSVRLDSAIRMHLKSRLRELHNENQKIIGEEFGADGIEISVHSNPAIDHEKVQGRQFSNEQYDILQNGGVATDIKGKQYTLDHDNKNGYRPISELNCYHYVFSIILGASEPEYSDKQLKEIIDNNNKGFDFEGKHYTMYEGTQLQRQIERNVREQKDIYTLASTSGNVEVMDKCEMKLKWLKDKYKALNKTSGLLPKAQRMRI